MLADMGGRVSFFSAPMAPECPSRNALSTQCVGGMRASACLTENPLEAGAGTTHLCHQHGPGAWTVSRD